MKILSDDYQDIMQYLVQKRNEGDEYVAFLNDSARVAKEELFTHSSQFEAQEFCYEMSTDIDRYEYLAIRSTYRTMAEAITDSRLLIEENGLVDIGAMVLLRYQRLEEALLNNNKKTAIMNMENYNYLKDQVKFTGFGDGLVEELKQKMEQQEPTFSLTHEAKYGNDITTAALNFRRDEKSGMYFFNSYKLELHKGSGDTLHQQFYVGKENNYTLKEAYNLLAGRAVHKELINKEGEKYNAWVQLNFKETDTAGNYKPQIYHENYGFRLTEILTKHPIKELEDIQSRDRLIASLERGNRQMVTMHKDGVDKKYFIEASPQFKSINIYEGNTRVRQSEKKEQTVKESQGVKQKEKQKQSSSDEDGPAKNKQSAAKQKKARKNQSI